jgi:prepilin-type N-terminal cleavage/methylation domain-containing protein/prepilin-type processing-associated H-X9-DG protein
MSIRRTRGRGFTLMELLVVLGIMALLMGLLLPALSRVRAQASSVACMSNLRQVGTLLLIYSNQNRGWVYPVGERDPFTGAPQTFGTNVPRDDRWPTYVFDPRVWNPPTLICPSDIDPAEEHTYVLNMHLAVKGVRFGGMGLGALKSPETVVAGEKRTTVPDYYMERGPAGSDNSEFNRVVEPFRHGVRLGSNYLYLDLHVSTTPPDEALEGIDPWAGGLPPGELDPDPGA